MITYNISERGKEAVYIFLYRKIKEDILEGKFEAGYKMPSKRTLAMHLGVSVNTIENAYDMLVQEGYLETIIKKGYFVVEPYQTVGGHKKLVTEKAEDKKELFELYNNATSSDSFPYTIWARQLREVLSEKGNELFSSQEFNGMLSLRNAIAEYLFRFKNISCHPSQIVIGSGTEYLYSVLIRVLGRDKKYAIEDPGFERIYRMYKSGDIDVVHLPICSDGISLSDLYQSNADILHISPSHHFPTGIVTSIQKKKELLNWMTEKERRYIIEDDFDSEFYFEKRAVPPLASMDERVIYLNTFSKTISPAIRIGYLVLPPDLAELAKAEFSLSSCPVSAFEQQTLGKFIEKGHFEGHISRMRRLYKAKRDEVIAEIKAVLGDTAKIHQEESGLHFLLEVKSDISDVKLKETALNEGIKLSFLSEYYQNKENAPSHMIIVNFTSINAQSLSKSLLKLKEIIKKG